uniref:Uncharacterized protein n=1 Tax=Lygus hesperus TaxID=30085 RepID=A0A0K8SC11_LYGHE
MGISRPLQFTGEFKKFFRLDKGPECPEETPDVLENDGSRVNYKMWFFVALIVCLCIAALVCAFQIINLEEKFISLSGYAIKCRNLVPHEYGPPAFDEFIEEVEEVPPEEPSEECEDRSDPQDPIMYPARVSIESENRKERTLRKSSRTKRSSRSESSKKSKRTIRQSSKTLKKLEKSASSLVDRETNAKLLGRGNGTTKFLAPWVMKE